jgi:hypothetical protein
MPSFYVMSLFQRQHEKYCQRFAKARQELEDYVASVESQGGNEEVAEVFRAYLDIPWGYRLKGERLPEVPPEGLPLLDQFMQMNRREAAIARKLRNSAFCYADSLVPPYVLWCYGIDWDDLDSLEEDGKLPLRHVRRLLRLLDVLLDGEPHFPTAEEVVSWDMHPEASTWERIFWKKRRHLVWLFRTALKLEEDLICGI